MINPKFNMQFIMEQKEIMEKFEAALCNHSIPGKENEKQCSDDFATGQDAATQNYRDALDEIIILRAKLYISKDESRQLEHQINELKGRIAKAKELLEDEIVEWRIKESIYLLDHFLQLEQVLDVLDGSER